MYHHAIVLIILLGQFAAQTSSASPNLLDLTKPSAVSSAPDPDPPDENSDDVWIDGYDAYGSTKFESGLIVSILHLDKSAYKVGDDAIVEIGIQNAGSTAVVLPWSCDRAKVNPSPSKKGEAPGLEIGLLHLGISDGSGIDAQTTGTVFYGSQLAPESLRTVVPGETIIIRAPIRIDVIEARSRAKLLGILPKRCSVKVTLRIFDRSSQPSTYRVISKNTVAIDLTK